MNQNNGKTRVKDIFFYSMRLSKGLKRCLFFFKGNICILPRPGPSIEWTLTKW